MKIIIQKTSACSGTAERAKFMQPGEMFLVNAQCHLNLSRYRGSEFEIKLGLPFATELISPDDFSAQLLRDPRVQCVRFDDRAALDIVGNPIPNSVAVFVKLKQ